MSTLRRSFSTSYLDHFNNNNNTHNNNSDINENNTSPREEFVRFSYDVFAKIREMNDDDNSFLTFSAANLWSESRSSKLIYKEYTITPTGSPYTWLLTADEQAQCAVMLLSTDNDNRQEFLENLVMWKKQPWEDAAEMHIKQTMTKVCHYLFANKPIESNFTVLENIKTLRRLPNISNINISKLCNEAEKIVETRSTNNINNISEKWKNVLYNEMIEQIKPLLEECVEKYVLHGEKFAINWNQYNHWPIIDNIDIRKLADDAKELYSNVENRKNFLLNRRDSNHIYTNLWYNAFYKIINTFVAKVAKYLRQAELYDAERVFAEMKASSIAERMPILWNDIDDIIPSEIIGDGGYLLITQAQSLSNRKKPKTTIEKYICKDLAQFPSRQYTWRNIWCNVASSWIEKYENKNNKLFRVCESVFKNSDIPENIWKARSLLYMYTHTETSLTFIGRIGNNTTLQQKLSSHILASFGLIDTTNNENHLYAMIRMSQPEEWQLVILRSVIPPRSSLQSLQCYWITELCTIYPRGLNKSPELLPQRDDDARFSSLCSAYITTIQQINQVLWNYGDALNNEDQNMLQNRSIAYLVSNIRGLGEAIHNYERQKITL